MPLILARYSATGLIGPYCLISAAATSSSGSSSPLVDADVPVAVRHDVVAGAGLRLGGRGQLVLLALRGDVVDLHLDVVLVAPFVAELVSALLAPGTQWSQQPSVKCSGGIDAADIRRGNGSGGTEGSGLENGTT